MDANKKKDSDFPYFYQTLKFQENTTDKIQVSRAKRMQLLINTLESEK